MARQIVPTAPGKMINSTAANMATTLLSPVIDTAMCDSVSWEGVYTGTPTGVFTIEGSNQYDPISNANPTFVPGPAPSPAFPVPAGAGGSFIVATNGLSRGGARFQRLRYAPSGGTGVMNLWVSGTGNG